MFLTSEENYNSISIMEVPRQRKNEKNNLVKNEVLFWANELFGNFKILETCLMKTSNLSINFCYIKIVLYPTNAKTITNTVTTLWLSHSFINKITFENQASR